MASEDESSAHLTSCDCSSRMELIERERELLNKERQLLEDRITDLEAKNLELTQANVSLLEENKALKNEFDKTIKDCLIKVAAGRREHKQFINDLDQHVLKVEEAKTLLDEAVEALKQAKTNYDPLYIFNHQFEDSLTFGQLERLNSNRLKSLPHKENISRPGPAPKDNELEAVAEESHSVTRVGNNTPSFQRFDPKSPYSYRRPSAYLNDTYKSWVYTSPAPPQKMVYFSDSLDSIQNFQARSMFDETERSLFHSAYRSTPKPPPKKEKSGPEKPKQRKTSIEEVPVRRSARPKKKVSYKV